MAFENDYTPTQKRILEALADGMPHSYAELLKCLNDDLGTLPLLVVHITNLRKKLPKGEEIICQLAGYSRGYRHIRSLVPKN